MKIIEIIFLGLYHAIVDSMEGFSPRKKFKVQMGKQR